MNEDLWRAYLRLARLLTSPQDSKERLWMNKELQTLRANAVMEIKDAALKQQFEQVAAAMKKAAAGN